VSVIIGVAVEDDEAFFAPKKNQILLILIFPCTPAKETAWLPLAEDELLTPGCPEPFQVKLLFSKFLPFFQYIIKIFIFNIFVF